jgi:hypothetical protein
MALTLTQLTSLGFKPSVRGRGGLGKTKKYDSLVLPINDTDFLYTGYNPYKKEINYKTIWKSFKSTEGERITYQVANLADTGLLELKDYIDRTNKSQFTFDNNSGTLIQPYDIELENPSEVLPITDKINDR